MPDELRGKRIAILVTDGFEQVELTEPRKALESAGAKTLVVAPHGGEVQGMNHDEKAGRIKVDAMLDDAEPEEFDAVLLPGGALNADRLRLVEKAQDFVRAMDENDKPMAVICHAPWLLVSSGLVGGRRLTSWPTLQDDIRNAGGEWVDEEVVHDDNLVTSRGPKDLPAFNKAILELIAGDEQERRAA